MTSGFPPRLLFLCVLFLVAIDASAANGVRRVLIEPAAPLTQTDRAELAAAGIEIGKPVPGGRFLAKLRPGADVHDARIRSIEDLKEQHKLHKSAIREAGRGKALAEVTVTFHDDVTLDEAQAAVRDAGGVLADALPTRFAYSHRLTARLPNSAVSKLARDGNVLTITGTATRRRKPQNANAALLSHVTELRIAPYSLNGAGSVLSLYELGQAQYTHPDFGGRLTTHDPSAFDAHATHVAGTIGGSGLGNSAAMGMSPAATLHQFYVGYDHAEILLSKDYDLAPLGIVADNNSWGYVLGWDFWNGYWEWQDLEDYFGSYDLFYSAPLDRITREKNVLFVHSAGNDADVPSFGLNGVHKHYGSTANWCFAASGCAGSCTPGHCEVAGHMLNAPYLTIGDMSAAKNVLAVGAVDGAKTIAYFSSRGPMRDGRVKPELVARGVSVSSTIPTNSYGTFSGTSMSAPVVTGIAGLLTQQWRATFGGATPLPAQLKTLMIAGAEDLGNAGPDYTYGFGLVDAKVSADLIRADGGTGARIRSGALEQGQTYEVDVTLATPQNLRVVLGWADPEIAYLGGSDVALPALVNDLDVRVVGPDGTTTTYPYLLSANAPAALATRGTNHVDNTEMVEIAGAAAGTYRIIVDATNITDAPPQAFVLIANAPVSNAAAPVVLTATGSPASVSLSWTASTSGTTYDVYYRSDSGAFTLRAAGLTGTSYVDSAVSSNAAYAYKILAHPTAGAAFYSNVDIATTITFDATLAAGHPIQFAHVSQLTTVCNLLRSLAGLGPISFTNAPQAGGVVRATHVTDLRAAVAAARTALSLPVPTFPSGGSTIQAVHFTEIRDALK